MRARLRINEATTDRCLAARPAHSAPHRALAHMRARVPRASALRLALVSNLSVLCLWWMRRRSAPRGRVLLSNGTRAPRVAHATRTRVMATICSLLASTNRLPTTLADGRSRQV